MRSFRFLKGTSTIAFAVFQLRYGRRHPFDGMRRNECNFEMTGRDEWKEDDERSVNFFCISLQNNEIRGYNVHRWQRRRQCSVSLLRWCNLVFDRKTKRRIWDENEIKEGAIHRSIFGKSKDESIKRNAATHGRRGRRIIKYSSSCFRISFSDCLVTCSDPVTKDEENKDENAHMRLIYARKQSRWFLDKNENDFDRQFRCCLLVKIVRQSLCCDDVETRDGSRASHDTRMQPVPLPYLTTHASIKRALNSEENPIRFCFLLCSFSTLKYENDSTLFLILIRDTVVFILFLFHYFLFLFGFFRLELCMCRFLDKWRQQWRRNNRCFHRPTKRYKKIETSTTMRIIVHHNKNVFWASADVEVMRWSDNSNRNMFFPFLRFTKLTAPFIADALSQHNNVCTQWLSIVCEWANKRFEKMKMIANFLTDRGSRNERNEMKNKCVETSWMIPSE